MTTSDKFSIIIVVIGVMVMAAYVGMQQEESIRARAAACNKLGGISVQMSGQYTCVKVPVRP